MVTQEPPGATITVFLADDNVIVREGVRTLLERQSDIEVVGVAEDYDTLVAGVVATQPNVLVTDIRMPPSFQREGIEAAREVRQRCPGTGVVILSQYDDPEYAVSLVAEGSAGYGYLLKDHIAEGNQLVDAVRAVATGGTALDPSIVDALVSPVTTHGGLTANEEALLNSVAEGKPIKAIAVSQRTTPEAVDAQVEALFVKLAQGVSAGTEGAIRRLRLLHQCIVDREEQGESLSRLLPGGLAEKLRRDGRDIGKTEVVEVTVLMSDIRSYSTIAEHADPGHPGPGRDHHAVRRGRSDGRLRRSVLPAGPRHPGPGRSGRCPPGAGRGQRPVGTGRPAGVRPRARPLHRRGRGRTARIGGEARVHPGLRYGQPVPTPAAAGRFG
jgi:adenylate cyclase